MSAVHYHESRPLNDNSSGFKEFDSVDWEIEDQGRKLLKNSIYVEADLIVFTSGSTQVALQDAVGVSRDIGFHSFFESWSVDAKSQNIQNIQHYPRYCNIIETCSSNIGSVYSPASQAEGKQVSDEACRYACQAVAVRQITASDVVLSDVAQICIKPKICLNSQAGDDYSFAKNGAIRISCNLARNGTALHGVDVVYNSSYQLNNIRLKYITVPDDGKQAPILMNSVVSVKNTINSNQANLSVKVPAQAVQGVIVSYISQADETSLTNDSYVLQKIPQHDEIEYLFSDSQSKYVSYAITDQDEMALRGLEALSALGKGKSNNFKQASGEGVVHGLNFHQSLNLSNQKFAVNIRSSFTGMSLAPRNVYMHFLNVINL